MNTPWGEVEVCDAHAHFFSHSFLSALARQKGIDVIEAANLLGWHAPDPDPVRLAGSWVEELDKHEVAKSVLIASIPGDEDSVSAVVAAYPDRFYGYFMFDPTQDDASARADAAFKRGLRGLCLFPAMHRYSLANDRLPEVLTVAARYPGTIIFVHCGVLSVGVRKKLGLPSRFDMRFSNPIDLHRLALDFEQLPFVIPHFGAGYLRESLMLADLCGNVHLDTSSSNSWIRYETPALSLEDVFRRALDVAGPNRLLFGTDSSFFPRGWMRAVFDAQSEVLLKLGVSASDAKAILGGNLRRLLER